MSFEVPEAQRLAALYNLGQMDIPIEPRLMQHIKSDEKQVKNADVSKQLGVPLQVVTKHHGTQVGMLKIPSLIVAAEAKIRADLGAEGLFRVGGAASKMQQMTEALRVGTTLTEDDVGMDLPEPLLTYRFYNAFISAAKLPDHDDKVRAVMLLCLDLPTDNLHLLVYICSLLAAVTANEVNRMKMTPAEIQAQSAMELRNHGPSSQAVAFMILHHAELGLVPDDVQFMASQFEEEEASRLYKQLLALPPGEWYEPNEETGGLGRSASERPSKKVASKSEWTKKQKKQNRHTVVDFGSFELPSHMRTIGAAEAP
eukprot:gene790-15135_t